MVRSKTPENNNNPLEKLELFDDVLVTNRDYDDDIKLFDATVSENNMKKSIRNIDTSPG